jgi:hypothetical protein
VYYKKLIEHTMAKVQEQLPEVLVAIYGAIDVAPTIIPDDCSAFVVGIDVLKYIILVGTLLIPASYHLPDTFFKLHGFGILNIDLRVGSPYLGHPVVGHCQSPGIHPIYDLLAEGTFARTISAQYDGYLCVSLLH